MDSWMGGASGSGDEQDIENQCSSKGKRAHHRHSSDQTAKLEALFMECPHPDESQRRQIARELGLEPKQVKFWFQNKRTQVKTLNERADNSSLRVENERMQKENKLIKEALKNIVCASCRGSSNGDEERERSLKLLRLENARLKEEHDKVSTLLAKYLDKPNAELELATSTGSSSHDPSIASSLKLALLESVSMNNLSDSAIPDEDTVSSPTNKRTNFEKAIMSQLAIAAKEELLKLLWTNEPLWVKSSNDRKSVLHPASYGKLFPRINPFTNSKLRLESSKDSRVVRIKAMKLVDMFLDSDKWYNLFSTIIKKAQTIAVIELGSIENRSGALLLMQEEMHVLSPLVPSREFYFLRYCEQVEVGIWVIADVSVDCMKDASSHPCWRFPSGVMLHEVSDSSTQVCWVEHVEVDERIQTHRLFRDIVNTGIAYGAERWLMELQRMCERYTSAGVEYIPSYDTGGVITVPEGRRSMMRLSHKMVKNFFEVLNMPNKMDFPEHLAEENGGVRISIRKNTDPGQSNPVIIIAASTSFWLPLPSQRLFEFFRDPTNRVKWDALCGGNSLFEIARISTGAHPCNHVSIIRPDHPTTGNMLIVQESFVDPLGSYVVYSPVHITEVKKAICGIDSPKVSVLPSGIVISEDGQYTTNAQGSSSENGNRITRGSLLTAAFQILMHSPPAMNLESVTSVNSLIHSTVQNIKDALINGSNLES